MSRRCRTHASARSSSRAFAGVTLGQLRSVSESSASSQNLGRGGFGAEFAFAAAAPTPLSPGESEVSLTVFVVYEID